MDPFWGNGHLLTLRVELVGECAEYGQLYESSKFEEIFKELKASATPTSTELNKLWVYFINSTLTPSKHVLIMRQDRSILLYALVKGCSLNVGKIVEHSIMDYTDKSFSRNIPHLALITLLCIKEVVTFSKT